MMRQHLFFLFAVLIGVMMSNQLVQAHPKKSVFGKTSDGKTVHMYTIKNKNGSIAKLITRGATLAELHVPGKNGKIENVVLGFDSVKGYESKGNQYFGCTTGRVAGRIAKGTFTLGGKTYKLAINNDENHLHGGVKRSLDKVVWNAKVFHNKSGQGVKFEYTSPDGEEGYPGNLKMTVTYTFNDKDQIRITYKATTDQATPINLTNHSYFNLSSAGSKTVLDHLLMINGDKYTPVDKGLIPNGKLVSVKGTPYDFTKLTRIGERQDKVADAPGLGYDMTYLLKGKSGKMRLAARLADPSSGRFMTVRTTEPAVQLYTGNHLYGQEGTNGKIYPKYSAICLETQHIPDAVHHKNFPSVILEPGETYTHTCVYAFSVKK